MPHHCASRAREHPRADRDRTVASCRTGSVMLGRRARGSSWAMSSLHSSRLFRRPPSLSGPSKFSRLGWRRCQKPGTTRQAACHAQNCERRDENYVHLGAIRVGVTLAPPPVVKLSRRSGTAAVVAVSDMLTGTPLCRPRVRPVGSSCQPAAVAASARLAAHAVFGSSTSRRPSPKRFRPSTVRAMAPPGKSANQGFAARKFCASFSMSPQDGCGGWVPSPR